MLWLDRMLNQAVSELIAKVARKNRSDANVDDSESVKCLMLKQKLDALLATVDEEAATTCAFTAASTVRTLDTKDSQGRPNLRGNDARCVIEKVGGEPAKLGGAKICKCNFSAPKENN